MVDTNVDPATLSRAELVAALHDHLEATAQLPIDATTNRWLGEAEAAAADIADGPAPDSVVEKRAGQVRHLLENAGTPENEQAREHATAALALTRELLARETADGA